MKFKLISVLIGIYTISCTELPKKESSVEVNTSKLDITGTWKLISSHTIVAGDTTFQSFTDNVEGIKVINETHFSFFQHDLNEGKDSTSRFSSGGGKYILNGNTYIEYLEYCNARAWENNRFEFELALHGDTLIQKGTERVEVLDVDRVIVETYARANERNTPVAIENEFEEDEMSWFTQSGNGSIGGVAKFKSKAGSVKYGSQFRIELMPYTSYTAERLSKIYNNADSGSIFVQDGVPRFIPDPYGYHKTIQTQCSEEGEFEFANLPMGTYYVIAFMLWDENGELNGGGIMRKISLKTGESAQVEMYNFDKK